MSTFRSSQMQFRPFLFMGHLHTDGVQMSERITTLFVRRCVYFAFFGKPSPRSSNELHSEPPADEPLFVPEDTPMEETRPSAERAEQERLCIESEERAAVELAAEQERLRREAEVRATAELAEQDRQRREAEDRAAAEQARLQREAEREAEELAEQERIHGEMEERAEEEQAKHMERLRSQQEPCAAEDYPEEVDRERVARAAQNKHPEQDVSAPMENASKRVTQLDLRSLLGQRP
ncbi:hypothetical protein ACJ73_03503 [Blastomyces percursus]|uniref:Uncharacterized protein n=1 Tax=Blastomyces percursus TaxID=1658174 RepID=A0A1J9R9D1_9EURO|nr:hypothetical protein ACJ73_03503 [Blastomyces percursus]